VVGTAHPDRLWRKNGARPGDVLFLTKPLGTGLVLTGGRKGLLGGEEQAAAAESMTLLNGEAAELLRPFEPNAVTDVTGFGLFGHAYELAERSQVRLVLRSEGLPALPGALAAAGAGIRTGGDQRNRDFAAIALDAGPASEPTLALGFDPQTAGGLLISLPEDRAPVLETTFAAAGVFLARVGRIEAGSGVALE
jgi:selenide,water dikinase